VIELANPVVRGGFIADASRAIPLSDVTGMEMKVFSPRKTIYLFSIPLGAVLGFLILACPGGNCGP
jgi:hypothetical protein